MNVSIEDYLRTIYSIFETNINEGVRSIDIARKLNISRPSVSAMIRKLTKKGYLKSSKYSKVLLTGLGKNKARKIMYNHRVIEVFLIDMLGHDISTIHKEAHRLEHAFSDKSIKTLHALLNNPKISPTGKWIPNNTNGVKVMNTTIDKMKKGQEGRIINVLGTGNIHKRILKMGIVKGARIEVGKVAPLGDPIEIKVKGYSLLLRKDEAKNIKVALE